MLFRYRSSSAAVKLIRAAAEYDVQSAARGVPEFSRHSGRVGLHFLDCVDAGGNHAIGGAYGAGDGFLRAQAVQV